MTKALTTQTATSGMMAILDTAEKVQSGLSKAEGMQRAVAMACGLVELQAAMSDDVVAVLMALQGNPMGFRSDKVYPPETVKACAISALLSGAYLVDDEWQIISGQCYLGQRYFLRKLREYPGVTDLEVVVEIPEQITPTLLYVSGLARCRVNGIEVAVYAKKSEKHGDSRIAVTAYKGDLDQAQGKARKRLAQRLYERIAGVVISDVLGDQPEELESASVLTLETDTVSETAVPAEEIDWKSELYAHGGPDSFTVKCGRRMYVESQSAKPMDGIAAQLMEARDNVGDLIDQRAYDTLERYGAWLIDQVKASEGQPA